MIDPFMQKEKIQSTSDKLHANAKLEAKGFHLFCTTLDFPISMFVTVL